MSLTPNPQFSPYNSLFSPGHSFFRPQLSPDSMCGYGICSLGALKESFSGKMKFQPTFQQCRGVIFQISFKQHPFFLSELGHRKIFF